MLAAGLLAKKACRARPQRASVCEDEPCARLARRHGVLQENRPAEPLDTLGFQTVGYGCTTCIGNSGPLDPRIEETVTGNDLVVASVLSGNRNFEARVHQNVKANFLMSPPLVVAFALAGRVDIDMTNEPLGKDKDGTDVYLRDLWPTSDEIGDMMSSAFDADTYQRMYSDFAAENPLWNNVPAPTGNLYDWNPDSTYIQEPPYFNNFGTEPGKVTDIHKARPLAIFGHSVTTDHISPAGAIKPSSPAGWYLQAKMLVPQDFNSYGSRRGNDRIMTRGTLPTCASKT
jgi:aconitate hydratase